MSIMSTLSFRANTFATGPVSISKSLVNTPFYKSEFARFKGLYDGQHTDSQSVSTTDTTYHGQSPIFFPTLPPFLYQSSPIDTAFFLTVAFAPRVLSIHDVMPSAISTNTTFSQASTIEKHLVTSTKIVFGDSAVIFVKHRASDKPAAVEESITRENSDECVATTTTRSQIMFGDAEPIYVQNSRFNNTCSVNREHVSLTVAPTSPLLVDSTKLSAVTVMFVTQPPTMEDSLLEVIESDAHDEQVFEKVVVTTHNFHPLINANDCDESSLFPTSSLSPFQISNTSPTHSVSNLNIVEEIAIAMDDAKSNGSSTISHANMTPTSLSPSSLPLREDAVLEKEVSIGSAHQPPATEKVATPSSVISVKQFSDANQDVSTTAGALGYSIHTLSSSVEQALSINDLIASIKGFVTARKDLASIFEKTLSVALSEVQVIDQSPVLTTVDNVPSGTYIPGPDTQQAATSNPHKSLYSTQISDSGYSFTSTPEDTASNQAVATVSDATLTNCPTPSVVVSQIIVDNCLVPKNEGSDTVADMSMITEEQMTSIKLPNIVQEPTKSLDVGHDIAITTQIISSSLLATHEKDIDASRTAVGLASPKYTTEDSVPKEDSKKDTEINFILEPSPTSIRESFHTKFDKLDSPTNSSNGSIYNPTLPLPKNPCTETLQNAIPVVEVKKPAKTQKLATSSNWDSWFTQMKAVPTMAPSSTKIESSKELHIPRDSKRHATPLRVTPTSSVVTDDDIPSNPQASIAQLEVVTVIEKEESSLPSLRETGKQSPTIVNVKVQESQDIEPLDQNFDFDGETLDMQEMLRLLKDISGSTFDENATTLYTDTPTPPSTFNLPKPLSTGEDIEAPLLNENSTAETKVGLPVDNTCQSLYICAPEDDPLFGVSTLPPYNLHYSWEPITESTNRSMFPDPQMDSNTISQKLVVYESREACEEARRVAVQHSIMNTQEIELPFTLPNNIIKPQEVIDTESAPSTTESLDPTYPTNLALNSESFMDNEGKHSYSAKVINIIPPSPSHIDDPLATSSESPISLLQCVSGPACLEACGNEQSHNLESIEYELAPRAINDLSPPAPTATLSFNQQAADEKLLDQIRSPTMISNSTIPHSLGTSSKTDTAHHPEQISDAVDPTVQSEELSNDFKSLIVIPSSPMSDLMISTLPMPVPDLPRTSTDAIELKTYQQGLFELFKPLNNVEAPANSSESMCATAASSAAESISGVSTLSSDNITINSEASDVSSHESAKTTTRSKPLATACDYASLFKAPVDTQAGVFLKTKGKVIRLPNKYLPCPHGTLAECRALTKKTGYACAYSRHQFSRGAIVAEFKLCSDFVMYGRCKTVGKSCEKGIHPCPNASRFNSCSTKDCKYDHTITIDTYGRSLFSANEPNEMPRINDMRSLHSIADAVRTFDLDPPGTGTPLGPRNDNDWRNIKKINIMPTMDELIPGRKTVYMPSKEKMFPLPRVLDVAFRHYRESSLGPIRDSVADAMARVLQRIGFPTTSIEAAGTTYNVYQNARVDRYYGTEGRSATTVFSISFTSPGHEYISRDKVLRSGHLLALLTMSNDIVQVTWLKAIVGWSDRDGSGRICGTGKIDAELVNEPTANEDFQRLAGLKADTNTSILLDFGGALLDGFVNSLKVLQKMSCEKLPFVEALFLPEVGSVVRELPLYLQDLEIDLSPLGYNITVQLPAVRSNPRWERKMRKILASPNQDQMCFTGGQATAIINSLTSSLSAIQGPPGTGKSFIGRRIAKLICTTRRKYCGEKTIPVLLATQTNHALDETLAGYIKSGLKVARFGIPQGKENPEPEHVAWRGCELPQEEGRKLRRRIMEAKRGRDDAAQELMKLLEEASTGVLSWFRISPHLDQCCPHFRRAFNDTVSDGRSGADGLFNYWAANKDASEATILSSAIQDTIPEAFRRRGSSEKDVGSAETTESPVGDSGRSVEELLGEEDPWRLSGAERLRLVNSWRQELNKSLFSRVQSAQAALHAFKLEFEEASQAETVAKIIGFGVDVIGCTTTRVARDHELFKKLGIEVLVVEEAGEVIEANTLTGLLPSLQQLIAIGDHRQLKPFCDHRALTGAPFEHDQSLFERLVSPGAEGAPPIITLAQLDTQRRMRPQIADLLRALSLYPVLFDGENVKEYPDVPGMGGRHLAWVNHQVGERFGADKSFSNEYEAEMIAAHAGHLARTGEFGIRSMVIISPYNAQVRAIHAALCQQPPVVIAVPEGDMELLAGRNPEYRAPLLSVAEAVTLVNVRLEDVVRVTTVDNFQGEEADVVFYSAVRSNRLGRLGFTDVSNRVCVTLSRARHALYIYGNAETARSGGDWWRTVVEHLERKDLITNGVMMGSCPRHPASPILVSAPSGFGASTILGSCDKPCPSALACGHVCGRACHAETMHGMPGFSCQSPCGKILPCGHPCGEECGRSCGSCTSPQTLILPCGHELPGVPCHQVRQVHRCLLPCPALLSCGHGCEETCGTWACRQGSHSVCSTCRRDDFARVTTENVVTKIAQHNGWFHSFVKTYQARAVSLSQGRQGSRTNREVLLDRFCLSRAGLGENGYILGTRMNIFRSFGEEFRVGMVRAVELEEAGGEGLVKRLEAFKATVRSAVEEDYRWFYQELVKRSSPGNSALLFAARLKVAVQRGLGEGGS